MKSLAFNLIETLRGNQRENFRGIYEVTELQVKQMPFDSTGSLLLFRRAGNSFSARR